MNNTVLTFLSLHRDIENHGYYFNAVFRVEDDSAIREVNIPKIRLPIDPNRIILNYLPETWGCPAVDMGFGYLPLERVERDGHDVYATETVIEEKTHEMTLDEIEKKLGYKVKIINKKE